MSNYLDTYTGSHALIVGINVYPNAPNFNTLGEAERDAMDLADVLEGESYNIEVCTLLAEEATRAAIAPAALIGSRSLMTAFGWYFPPEDT